MKIFFDTEFFENGRTIDLISIGMVREDGAEYYAETAYSYVNASRSEWLIKNVSPHLKGIEAEKSLVELRNSIIDFVGNKPEFWAYYADYDWVALCQLYGSMINLPEGWPKFCMDIKQLAVSLGNPELPKQTSTEHHALADARWNKQCWEFLDGVRYDKEEEIRSDGFRSGEAAAAESQMIQDN